MVKTIMALLILVSVTSVLADCETNWFCDPWSDCEYGFQTRFCRDLSSCEMVEELPVQTKRCDDANDYEVKNTVIEERIEAPVEQAEPELINEEPDVQELQTPNMLVGLLIVGVFIVAGVLIGRKISN